ncbi:hypothetical protein DM49_2137 [Burkholderia mallei]|nr:hypothetical protein DM49_2137 [Burkholderia mallei]KOT00381.1 hypothetical protein DM50_1814 [Burkholderia mallei]KOT05761.1 hypothetical protein DM77_1087 [Burkholderia mallei]KOT19897.1 hypothetical protein DM52_490 [Burkholderia mallei]
MGHRHPWLASGRAIASDIGRDSHHTSCTFGAAAVPTGQGRRIARGSGGLICWGGS